MTVLHWTYLFFVFLVIVAMVKRRRVVLITTVGAFTIGLGYTGSLIGGGQTAFRAFLNAGISLFDIMLVIGLMVSTCSRPCRTWAPTT